MRLLNLPFPLLAAAFVPQIQPPEVTTPGYIAAAMGGAWLVLWYLQQIGKLPGANGERRSGSAFEDDDRARAADVAETVDMVADQMTEVHRIVTREDSDKPGWAMVWRSSKESHEVREAVAKLATLAETWIQDREDWRREKADLQARITRLEDINRAQERAIERGTG